MVYNVSKQKSNTKTIHNALVRTSSNMTSAPSSRPAATRSPKHSRLAAEVESDTDCRLTRLALQLESSQPDLLRQFEQMLTKALKHTSETITGKLTREIRDVERRTAELEQRADDLVNLAGNHSEELESLHEENLTLQSRLGDLRTEPDALTYAYGAFQSL